MLTQWTDIPWQTPSKIIGPYSARPNHIIPPQSNRTEHDVKTSLCRRQLANTASNKLIRLNLLTRNTVILNVCPCSLWKPTCSDVVSGFVNSQVVNFAQRIAIRMNKTWKERWLWQHSLKYGESTENIWVAVQLKGQLLNGACPFPKRQALVPSSSRISPSASVLQRSVSWWMWHFSDRHVACHLI